MNSLRASRFLRCAFCVGFGAMGFPALADTRAPLELTADALGSVVDPQMAAWIGKHKGPGAVVVVVTRDATVFAEGYGFADIEAKKPFTADVTLVRPGSISKLFTGIAVMQLVDQGKLDLDRDVNFYIDFAIPTPDGGVPVTLRRLLTHRAGFEEHFKGLFSRDRLFPNGDIEAYSNYGFALAGYIVERVSGEPYASYIQGHILDPLGMSHSTFRQPLPDDLAPLMARTPEPITEITTSTVVIASRCSTFDLVKDVLHPSGARGARAVPREITCRLFGAPYPADI